MADYHNAQTPEDLPGERDAPTEPAESYSRRDYRRELETVVNQLNAELLTANWEGATIRELALQLIDILDN